MYLQYTILETGDNLDKGIALITSTNIVLSFTYVDVLHYLHIAFLQPFLFASYTKLFLLTVPPIDELLFPVFPHYFISY